jgi:RNA 2',3'-cyclic 3'-phosphodiesterase
MGSGELEEDPRSLRLRAFFGLPVPEPQRGELARFIAECAQVAPDFRWTPSANLHVTIRFAGNVDRPVIDAVADALTGRLPAAFELNLGEIGTFGRGRAVRVVWIGLSAGAEAASALAAQVEAECVRAGLPAEQRAFRAHLTLARARSRDGSRLPDLPLTPRLDPWRADQLILYSSRLTKTGAIYEELRTIPLE